MYTYVWLNLNTGEFSNSWKDSSPDVAMDHLRNYYEDGNNESWKLIQFYCINDKDFEFNNLMKLR